MDIVEISRVAVVVTFNTAVATAGACLWALMLYGVWSAFKRWKAYSKHPAAVRLRRFRNARRKAKRERKAKA